MEATNSTMVVTVEPAASDASQEQQAAEIHVGDVRLVSRLVLGLLLFGGEALLSRLRSIQQRIEASGDLAAGDDIPEDETMGQVLGYLAVGMLLRGQQRLARTVKRGVNYSTSLAGWALDRSGRVTDNRLTRPFRAPVERRIEGLMMEGQGAISDGRREVYASRKLTDETVDELIEEVVQAIAENPELTSIIERVFAGQGVGMTTTVMGNARDLSVSADDLAEAMLRRLLGRKPRRELAPSPLLGKPLTMYEPRSPAQGGLDDDL
jgi:methyl-accepting chemotaxis protein